MDKLLKTFNEIYNDFYDNGYCDNWVYVFDNTLNESPYFKILVGMFADYRQDVISSDREAAAFMAAIKTIYQDIF